MAYFVYILKSSVVNRYYIGQTANLEDRLYRHNNGYENSTKPYAPWKIIYSESFKSRSEAVRYEQFLKSPRGWKTLQSIKHHSSHND